ncbi:uncharacterized protein LOC142632596 [Castanea sativa]|uniref:uncharacterized protein LOC142632596 n=1 Tax=Castanea sativa TaxID=21020 RepID=UPI003F64EC18
MYQSQSLNTPPFFDGSNYAFWKIYIRAFLCTIDESIWDSVENGYVRPTIAKSKWDKVALTLANANSKAIKAIFCGVSTDKFHKISHVKTAKEAWTILETTYEEHKMSDDESFDSFYGNLNEIVISKLNLSEKIEDVKVVRKILRSLPESYRVKVTAIERRKDLDEIKMQELIGSL